MKRWLFAAAALLLLAGSGLTPYGTGRRTVKGDDSQGGGEIPSGPAGRASVPNAPWDIPVPSGPTDSGYPCDFSTACSASNNLLAHAEDFANGAWSPYGSGAAAPVVTAASASTIDGQTVTTNRVQFAAVAGGQESSLYQRIDDGATTNACKRKTCTYSIYLRSHSGAAVPTGNLPVATAAGGGDGQNYQMCAFTTAWSRCELTMASTETAGFSFYWLGYVASQSGTSAALDMDIGGPKAEYGAGGATAFQCPSPLQVAGVPAHTGYVESQLTSDWGIIKRDGAGIVKVADGTLVLLGGWSGSAQATWNNNVTTNEIYKSTDDGVTWSAVQAYADAPAQTTNACIGGTCTAGFCGGGTCNLLACGTGACAPRWRRRHSHCAFTTTISGTEYIYVIGGDGFDSYYNNTADGVPPYPADVWRTVAATYGAANTWVRMTAAAEWGATTVAADNDGGLSGRVLHSCWADDSGNLYVAGGQYSLLSSSALNDVWKSTNGGTSWTSLGNAPWTGRGTIASPLPRFGGKTWLIAGEQYDVGAGSRVYFNDSWSFNDSTWSSVQPDAGFSPRGYHNTVAWNGRLWVLKGYPATNNAEIWSSAEGACWRKERAVAGGPDHAASVAISQDAGFLVVSGSSTTTSVTSIHAP